MADRLTLSVPVYLKIWNQWMIVYGGSTIDVASASALAPAHYTNLIVGGGTLTASGHNQPVANFRIKE
jgi:hypothetical protein